MTSTFGGLAAGSFSAFLAEFASASFRRFTGPLLDQHLRAFADPPDRRPGATRQDRHGQSDAIGDDTDGVKTE